MSELRSIRSIDRALRSRKSSVRWSAAHAATDYVHADPDALWNLIVKHGSSHVRDTRTAVAVCMLETLLELRFRAYFPRLERAIGAGNLLLGDTLSLCWRQGQARRPANARRWKSLIHEWERMGGSMVLAARPTRRVTVKRIIARRHSR